MYLQKYDKPESIEGVKIIDLKQHFDDSGSFLELARLEQRSDSWGMTEYSKFMGLDLSSEQWQVNLSKVTKGAVKAFHVHKEQFDVWFLMNKAIVNLIDLRKCDDGLIKTCVDYKATIHESYAPRMRLVLGNTPQLLVIPPMVAHGLGAVYEDVNMLYFVSKFFNPKDEYRLPWDFIGKDVWQVQNG